MVALFFLFLLALIAVIYFRIGKTRQHVSTQLNRSNNQFQQEYMITNPHGIPFETIYNFVDNTPKQYFGKWYNQSSLRRKNNRIKKKIDKAYQR